MDTQRCGSTRELRLREQLVPGGGSLVGGDTFEEARVRRHAQVEAVRTAGSRRASVVSVDARFKMWKSTKAEVAGAAGAWRASVVSVDTRLKKGEGAQLHPSGSCGRDFEGAKVPKHTQAEAEGAAGGRVGFMEKTARRHRRGR